MKQGRPSAVQGKDRDFYLWLHSVCQVAGAIAIFCGLLSILQNKVRSDSLLLAHLFSGHGYLRLAVATFIASSHGRGNCGSVLNKLERHPPKPYPGPPLFSRKTVHIETIQYGAEVASHILSQTPSQVLIGSLEGSTVLLYQFLDLRLLSPD